MCENPNPRLAADVKAPAVSLYSEAANHQILDGDSHMAGGGSGGEGMDEDQEGEGLEADAGADYSSVSVQKVQDVLLLLWGQESCFIDEVPREEEIAVTRKYDTLSGKRLPRALDYRMQRSMGQFISSKSKPEAGSAGVASWDGTQNWSSVDKQLLAATACHHFGTSVKSTPMMRCEPDGLKTLCNACGLVWANKGNNEGSFEKSNAHFKCLDRSRRWE